MASYRSLHQVPLFSRSFMGLTFCEKMLRNVQEVEGAKEQGEKEEEEEEEDEDKP